MTGLPGTNAPATASGVSMISRLSMSAGLDRGRPRDLEVVAGVVAEGRADEALERARVGRGGPRPPAMPRPSAARARRRAQVPPRLVGPVRGEPVPQRRRRDRRGGTAAPRGAGRAATRPRSGPARTQRASPEAPCGASPGCRRASWLGRARSPGPGPGDRPASQRPPLEVGRLGLARRPHRLEAVPLVRARRAMVAASASAIAWVARWSSAGSSRRLDRARPRRRRTCRPAGGRMRDRQDPRRRSSRRASPARPAASSRRRTGGPGCRRSR